MRIPCETLPTGPSIESGGVAVLYSLQEFLNRIKRLMPWVGRKKPRKLSTAEKIQLEDGVRKRKRGGGDSTVIEDIAEKIKKES